MNDYSMNNDGFFRSRILDSYKNIEHFFSTKKSGIKGNGFPQVENEIGYYLKQVHKNKILKIDNSNTKKGLYLFGEADGMLTHQKQIALYIKTADCLPVIIYDFDKQVISAIHSGWRSTLGNIVSESIYKMKNLYECDTKNMVMVIGPSISYNYFEVGREVIDSFEKKYTYFKSEDYFRVNKKTDGKYFMNLQLLVSSQAMNEGLDQSSIEIMNLCTYENKDLFYSYRRDGGHNRMWTKVMLK